MTAIEPFKANTGRKAKARGMGEILKFVDSITDDARLGAAVRAVAERVRQEEAAWLASLDEHGAPPKASA